MVYNRNTDLFKAFHDTINLRDGLFLDNEFSTSKVTPVMDVNIPIIQVSSNSVTTSGTIDVTFPSGKDVYVTGITISASYTAAADSTNVSASVTINGSQRSVLRMMKQTLTAFYDTHTAIFPAPMKIDRGSVISLTDSYTVGAGSKSINVYYYLSDSLAN